MLLNYLKIAVRNLRNNRAYALLNIFGLGLSIACSILIFILVWHHRSFDTYHSKADRIVRMMTEVHLEPLMQIAGVPNPFATALRTEFAGLEKAAMRSGNDNTLISVPDSHGGTVKFMQEKGFAFAEPELFQILDLPLLSGSSEALRDPNTAVLTTEMALKYFGTTDAIGRVFRFDNKVDISIVGVMQPLPANTDYRDEILVSWATLKGMPDQAKGLDSWDGIRGGTYCFALVREGHSIRELAVENPVFYKKYRHSDRDDLFQYQAKPITSLHLDPVYGSGTSEKYLWALTCIGIFLLLTACVNFINMATAQVLNRAREVGVRKALGSTRGQLFRQFMFETGVIVIAAVALGTLGAQLALPYLSNLTEQTLSFSGPGFWKTGIFLTLLTLLLTFAAGAYPGILQARFQPVLSLRGQSDGGKIGGFSLRRLLVTSQFAISQILIIGAAVITAQMQFARDADWGFRPGSIVALPIPVTDTAKMSALKQQLEGVSGVKSVSLCYQPPAASHNNQTGLRYDNRPEGENWLLNTKTADADYIPTFGLKLVAGRNIQPSDTAREFVVNETFVKKLNLSSPEDVLMKNITINGHSAPIVGVVHDFFHAQLSEPVTAIAINSDVRGYATCAVALQPGNPAPVLAQVQHTWESIYPDHFYEQHFADEQIATFLQTETTLFQLIAAFAGIAIFIGCLGLYGLAAFMVTRKRKEVGIRKTLGASVSGILWIFSKEYIRLIIIAFAVAAPLGWWLMNTWLQDYAYHITPGIGLFGMSLIVTFLVAAITVGIQSIRAALANPVKSLRSE
jgi:putative ABC transport system permease protein